ALLRPSGVVLAALPNPQHHASLCRLIRGDRGHPAEQRGRDFTYAAALKLFLDADFAPTLAGFGPAPCPEPLFDTLRPALDWLGLQSERARSLLDASPFLIRAQPQPEPAVVLEEPVTFVDCVSDEDVLASNLLASPDLAPGSPHEVLLFRGCMSAAEGLNAGL